MCGVVISEGQSALMAGSGSHGKSHACSSGFERPIWKSFYESGTYHHQLPLIVDTSEHRGSDLHQDSGCNLSLFFFLFKQYI